MLPGWSLRTLSRREPPYGPPHPLVTCSRWRCVCHRRHPLPPLKSRRRDSWGRDAAPVPPLAAFRLLTEMPKGGSIRAGSATVLFSIARSAGAERLHIHPLPVRLLNRHTPEQAVDPHREVTGYVSDQAHIAPPFWSVPRDGASHAGYAGCRRQ